MIISLMGPPGSGKGTYAEALSKKYKIPVIAIGRELRKITNTKLGKMLKETYWGKGSLIPSNYAMDILRKNLTKKGYILDGFPRELKEAKMFEKIGEIDAVIFIDVSQKTILQRLEGRLQCKKCGRIYHITNNPPKKSNTCDDCKIKLYERTDDKQKKIIKERFKVYNKQTKPVIEYYNKKNLLRKVNGEGSIPEVLKKIEKAIPQK